LVRKNTIYSHSQLTAATHRRPVNEMQYMCRQMSCELNGNVAIKLCTEEKLS